ncbi:hypothetical protein Tco_1517702 [Tanacetum coccineum]
MNYLIIVERSEKKRGEEILITGGEVLGFPAKPCVVLLHSGYYSIERVGRFVFKKYDFLRRWEGQGEYKKGIMLREDDSMFATTRRRNIFRFISLQTIWSSFTSLFKDNYFKTTEKSNAGGLNKRVKEKSLSSSTKLLEEIKDQKMEELEEDDTKAFRANVSGGVYFILHNVDTSGSATLNVCLKSNLIDFLDIDSFIMFP